MLKTGRVDRLQTFDSRNEQTWNVDDIHDVFDQAANGSDLIDLICNLITEIHDLQVQQPIAQPIAQQQPQQPIAQPIAQPQPQPSKPCNQVHPHL